MSDQEKRAKNLAALEAFLRCSGPERGVTRVPYFAEGGLKEMELPIPEKPVLQQQDGLEWVTESAKRFPIWGFYEPTIYQCGDPDLFLVKCVGRGNGDFGFGEAYYIKYYLNEVHMKDGKITLFRETYNPCEEWHE